MNPIGIRGVMPASQGPRQEGEGQKGMSDAARRKTLSYGRVMELIADLMNRRFYGRLALHFEAGHIVCAKLEQTIKE